MDSIQEEKSPTHNLPTNTCHLQRSEAKFLSCSHGPKIQKHITESTDSRQTARFDDYPPAGGGGLGGLNDTCLFASMQSLIIF